jgi:hypothetical protein
VFGEGGVMSLGFQSKVVDSTDKFTSRMDFDSDSGSDENPLIMDHDMTNITPEIIRLQLNEAQS